MKRKRISVPKIKKRLYIDDNNKSNKSKEFTDMRVKYDQHHDKFYSSYQKRLLTEIINHNFDYDECMNE